MNHIAIKGNLTHTPELKNTANAIPYCNVSVAVNDSKGNATFFPCIFWRKTAEFVCKYFTRGQAIIVEGRMQTRSYEDKTGQKKTVWELQADSAEFCGGAAAAPAYTDTPAEAAAAPVPGIPADDELPF